MFIVPVLAAAALCGCAADTAPLLDPAHIAARHLPPVEDGRTTLAQLSARLGEPPVRFPADRLAAYRLVLVENEEELPSRYPWGLRAPLSMGPNDYPFAVRIKKLDENGVLSVVREGDADRRPFRLATRGAEYTLVLELDGQETVLRHALVRVWP